MRGYIYNNPQLAYEGDGHWCFVGKKPHEYWCVLSVRKDHVLLAPVFFDVMDNLPNSVIDTCPIQISGSIQNITIGIGRCITRSLEDLTEPVMYLNPDKAKEAYNILAHSLQRAIGEE